MRPNEGHPIAGRLLFLAPYLLLATSCALLTVALVSCGDGQLRERSPISSGMRTIRVLLTPSPIASASLSSTGPCVVTCDGRPVMQPQGALGPVSVTRSDDRWRIGQVTARGETLQFSPADRGGLIRLDGKLYRGSLRLVPAGATAYRVINHVDMESYLAGVLPMELYGGWSVQTYRAQAVAARTYALFKCATFGRGRDYDVLPSVADQVYGGAAAETEKSRSAVTDTWGWVLACGPPGREKIFLTQYSSSNGGYVNGARVIRAARDIPPLRGGQADPDWEFSPNVRWGPVRIAKSDILKAVANRYVAARTWRKLTEIRIAKKTSYGRAVWLDLLSDDGKSLRIRAEDLRLVLLRRRRDIPAAKRLKSMNCRLRDGGKFIEFHDGRGFGHGVGLSQWGAEAKAQRGWSAERILEFYYPGAKIFRVY